MKVKVFLFSLMFAAITAGLAQPSTVYAYGNCVNNNSRACVEARNAFASHHGGLYPREYRARYAYRSHRWHRWHHHHHHYYR